MLSSPRYVVVRCPACSGVSVTYFWAAAKRCPYCGLEFTLRPKRDRSRILQHANTFRDAQLYLVLLQRQSPSPNPERRKFYRPPRGRPKLIPR